MAHREEVGGAEQRHFVSIAAVYSGIATDRKDLAAFARSGGQPKILQHRPSQKRGASPLRISGPPSRNCSRPYGLPLGADDMIAWMLGNYSRATTVSIRP